MPKILSIKVKDFTYGQIDTLEDTSIPRGCASRSLNFITKGDRIILRGGYRILGNNIEGTGKITGLYTARKPDGTEISFRKRGQKLEYYDEDNDEWTEINEDAFGEAAENEDVTFTEYHSTAGDFVYVNSPNGAFLKIDLDDPTTATDVYDADKNYKGYIKMGQSRMWLWGPTTDPTGIYLSKIGDPEDFTFSSPRVAGEGNIFRQDDGGGNMENIGSYENKEYCLHQKKSWVINITADDTDATNEIYREKVGIPNLKAMVPTADGIYYIDDSDKIEPQIRLMTIPYGMDKVIPVSISKAFKYKNTFVGIDLSGYEFDQSMGWEWGDYVIFSCRTSDSGQNNRLLLYNKKQKTIDVMDYFANFISNKEGDLLAGDSISGNVMVLFNGYADESASINNYWETKNDDLDFDGQKKVKKLRIKGRLGIDQAVEVLASLDKGEYVSLGIITVDSAEYTSTNVIGGSQIGEMEIGGGSEGDEYVDFETELDFAMGKFNRVKLKFVAGPNSELGYCEISEFTFWDLRLKSRRIPT